MTGSPTPDPRSTALGVIDLQRGIRAQEPSPGVRAFAIKSLLPLLGRDRQAGDILAVLPA